MIALYVCIGNNQSITRSDWQPQICRIFEPEKSWSSNSSAEGLFWVRWTCVLNPTITCWWWTGEENVQNQTPASTDATHQQLREAKYKQSVCAPESTPHLLPTCYVQATEQVASIHINLSHSKSCYDQNKKSLRDRPGNNISLFKNSLIKELSLAEIIRMELYSSIFITMIVTLIVQIISGKTDTHKLSSILPFLCCCMHHCTAPLMSSVSGGHV